MIRVTDRAGRVHLLAPADFRRVTEAGVSAQWNGIKSYVTCADGTTIDCQQSVDELERLLIAAARAATGTGT